MTSAAMVEALTVLNPILQLLAKALILLALGGLVTTLLARASAAMRHWVWHLTFCGLLLLPLMSFLLPAWRLDIIPQGPWQTAWMRSDAPVTPAVGDPPALTTPATQDLKDTGSPLAKPHSNRPAIQWPTWMLLVWLAGSLFVLGRLVFEILGLVWMRRRGRPNDGNEWSELLQRSMITLDITRPVALISSAHISVPVTFGLFRPVILIPVAAHAWNRDKKRMVVLHELAHVKRLDYLSNMIAEFVCAVYWMVPFVWMAARQLCRERERASDDRVLRQGIAGREYASQLLDIARALSEKGSLGQRIIAMVHHSELKDRLKHVMARKIRRHTLTHLSAMMSFVAVLFLVVPLAVMQLSAEDEVQSHPGVEGFSETPNPAMSLLKLNQGALREAQEKLDNEGQMSDVDYLVSILKAAHADQKIAALLALGEIGARRSFYPVIHLLKDGHPDVRIATLAALRGIACDPAFVAITATLRDPDERVRQMAALSLADLSYKPTHLPVQLVLSSYSPTMPRFMKGVLGPIENLTAVEYLGEALADGSTAVRGAAEKTLRKIASPDALRTLNPDTRRTTKTPVASVAISSTID